MSLVSTVECVEKLPQNIGNDPFFENQKFCLVSFIPAKNASPDPDGVFGMCKVRGVFATSKEANDRAEWLIRNHDASHSILTTYVGRPYPVCVDVKKYVEETNTVDLTSKISTTMREDAREKREQDRKAMAEIKQREAALLKAGSSHPDSDDVDSSSSSSSTSNLDMIDENDIKNDLDKYIMLRMKRANLIFMFNEQIDKLKNMRQVCVLTDNEIRQQDRINPSYKSEYMERYNNARAEVGCKFDASQPVTFMDYLDNDEELHHVLKTI